jgi:hypothetical protein
MSDEYATQAGVFPVMAPDLSWVKRFSAWLA